MIGRKPNYICLFVGNSKGWMAITLSPRPGGSSLGNMRSRHGITQGGGFVGLLEPPHARHRNSERERIESTKERGVKSVRKYSRRPRTKLTQRITQRINLSSGRPSAKVWGLSTFPIRNFLEIVYIEVNFEILLKNEKKWNCVLAWNINPWFSRESLKI